MVFYHHWSSLIWHEEEDFPFNVGLSKAKNDYKCNTWSKQKLSPQYLLRIYQWRGWELKNLENQRMKIVDESIFFFFRVSFSKILSRNSLHFVDIRVFIVGCVWNAKNQLQPNRMFWRLGLTTGTSHELTTWPDWKFCPVVQQLAWLFSSPACFTRVPPLATCQSRDPVARPFLSFFHTLTHTTLTWFSPKYRISKCWVTRKFGTE